MYRKSNGNSAIQHRQDIMNSISHEFGYHVEYEFYFFENDNYKSDQNYIKKIKSTDQDYYIYIMKHMRSIARHSSSLLQDVDSNIVEIL